MGRVLFVLTIDREEIMNSMYELLGKLDSEDNLLIYYAGHGEYVTDTNRGVWLPVDATPSSPANWITNVEINDYLKQIRAKEIIVIADSCYSGSLTQMLHRSNYLDNLSIHITHRSKDKN